MVNVVNKQFRKVLEISMLKMISKLNYNNYSIHVQKNKSYLQKILLIVLWIPLCLKKIIIILHCRYWLSLKTYVFLKIIVYVVHFNGNFHFASVSNGL